jgi:hypothetical protein
MSDMHNRLTLIIVVTLLLYSTAGQHLGEHSWHTHLLLGSVTPEQLDAHEAEEAREGQPLAITYPIDPIMTLHGGIIVSLLYGLDMIRVPVMLDGAFPAVPAPVSVICHSVPFPSLPGQLLIYPPLDPPPRFTFTLV